MIDLRPSADRVAALLPAITDDQLTAPTPCTEYTLGDLLDHLDGLSRAFTAAAVKDIGELTGVPPAGVSAAHLGDDWRTRIAAQLHEFGVAWLDPAAWQGQTQVGGVDLPGAAVGGFGLDEVLVHGWDIARASGQPYQPDPEAVRWCLEFIVSLGPNTPFGAPVPVPADAPVMDRLVAVTGRDPAW